MSGRAYAALRFVADSSVFYGTLPRWHRSSIAWLVSEGLIEPRTPAPNGYLVTKKGLDLLGRSQ